jgi:hypothetical protein
LTTRDFEVRTHDEHGAVEVVAGRRALDRFFKAFLWQWEELTYEFIEEPRLINGASFSHDRWSGAMRGSEARVIVQYFAVGTFRGGLCASMDSYVTREDAEAHLERLRG